jgi:hypothetical protein
MVLHSRAPAAVLKYRRSAVRTLLFSLWRFRPHNLPCNPLKFPIDGILIGRGCSGAGVPRFIPVPSHAVIELPALEAFPAEWPVQQAPT